MENTLKMNQLNVKRLTETAQLPTKNLPTDAGFDIFSDETITIDNSVTARVKTGIAIEIPEGFYGRLVARSGKTTKTILRVLEGTIDAEYRGEIQVMCDVRPILDEDTEKTYTIEQGEKIAQLIIQPLPLFEVFEVAELNKSNRGAQGFGSSDNKLP